MPLREVAPAFITTASYGEHSFLGGVYDETGVLQRRCMRPKMGAYDPVDPDVLPEEFAPQHTIPEAVYAGRYCQHFGHHLVETLPSLYAASQHGELLLAHPWPEGLTRHHVESDFRGHLLNALGISPERILFVNAPLRVDRLLTPDLPPPPMTEIVDDAFLQPFRKIRTAVLSTHDGAAQNVYLSRRKFSGGTKRRLVNEEAVESLLEARGFSILYPETMPILDQISAVARANVVVGVDGSAMHLCHFMGPGSKMVCIATRKFGALTAINKAAGILDCGVYAAPAGELNGESQFVVSFADLISAIESIDALKTRDSGSRSDASPAV